MEPDAETAGSNLMMVEIQGEETGSGSREEFWLEGDFEKRHGSILERFGKAIEGVDTEGLKLVMVIPAYKELENDNFWRLLRALATQRGVDGGEFGVLFGINSPGGRDCEENQAQLELLEGVGRVIDGEESLEEVIRGYESKHGSRFALTEHEKQVLKLVVEKRLKLVGVDLSELRMTGGANQIGVVRDVLGHLALELLKENPEKSWIDMLDADCSVSSGYVKELVERAESDAGAVLKELKAVLPDPIEVESDDAELRLLSRLYHYASLYGSFRARREWYAWMGLVPEGFGRESLSLRALGGPAVAVKPRVFKYVGGYHRFGLDSTDFAFSRLLYKVPDLGLVCATGGQVLLSIRGREGSVDGWGEAMIPVRLQAMGDFGQVWEMLEGFGNWMVRDLLELNKQMENEFGEEYVRLRDKEFGRESAARRITRGYIEEIVDEVVGVEEIEKLDDRAIFEQIKGRFEGRTRLLDYLESNQALLGLVRDVLIVRGFGVQRNKAGFVMEFLEKYLPDWVREPPKEVDYFNGLSKYEITDRLEMMQPPPCPRDYIQVLTAARKMVAMRVNSAVMS